MFAANIRLTRIIIFKSKKLFLFLKFNKINKKRGEKFSFLPLYIKYYWNLWFFSIISISLSSKHTKKRERTEKFSSNKKGRGEFTFDLDFNLSLPMIFHISLLFYSYVLLSFNVPPKAAESNQTQVNKWRKPNLSLSSEMRFLRKFRLRRWWIGVVEMCSPTRVIVFEMGDWKTFLLLLLLLLVNKLWLNFRYIALFANASINQAGRKC
jgi:hypothetical protein